MADSIPDNTTSTARLEGSPYGHVFTFSGQLEYAGDRDWIGIALQAGHTYEFNLDLEALIDGNDVVNRDAALYLHDSSGAVLVADDDGGAERSSLISFTATSSGLYFLDVRFYHDNQAANYSLAAIDTTADGINDTMDPATSYVATASQRVYAGYGDDNLTADAAGSQLFGGQGKDALIGSEVNDTMSGGIGDDTLYGNAGSDLLFGDSGNDKIYADSGADYMYGGLGNDTLASGGDDGLSPTMAGGDGDDTYIMTSSSGATITEAGTAAGGYDVIFTTQNFTMPYNVESMIYIGSLNATLLGNNQINAITGGGSNDTISGLNGDDTLGGGSGNDSLVGGLGNDVMNGGDGNDIMVVDSAGDKVYDAPAFSPFGETGSDTVFTSVSYALTAGQSINVFATTSQSGAGALNLAGNDQTQAIRGNNGVNTLTAGGGADSLYGFAGDDTYRVDNAAEKVFETVGQGSDTVFSSATYALQAGQSVELLAASSRTATTTLSLTGNEQAQRMDGNYGVNGLYGGDGNDTLYGFDGNDKLGGGNGRDQMDGGAGADTFAYSDGAQSTGVTRDLISNVNFAQDKFDVPAVPTDTNDKVVGGTLNEASFDNDLAAAIGALQLGPNHAVLFDPSAGTADHGANLYLIVDANGTPGYQHGDYVIELANATGTLTLGDFT